MTFEQFWEKARRKLLKMRLQPIRVFCFHQVSVTFEPDTMSECDWTQTEVFKRKVLALKGKYTFVSLKEAHYRLTKDKIRFKKYAALTSDDGWASIKNVLPWLAEQGIPVTLFLNPLYLDGKHFQWRETEKLLTKEEVVSLVKVYEPLVSIASHGWKHNKCVEMSDEEFLSNVQMAEEVLSEMPGKVPYYAFTFGHCTSKQVVFLQKHGLIPVFMDGEKNYSDDLVLHRELLDGPSMDEIHKGY